MIDYVKIIIFRDGVADNENHKNEEFSCKYWSFLIFEIINYFNNFQYFKTQLTVYNIVFVSMF